MLDGTWDWNGSDWRQLLPAVSPPKRVDFLMTGYSPVARIVVYGGTDLAGANLDDTWEWTGANWTRMSPPSSPSARKEIAFAYDSWRGRALLFGGYPRIGDTWVYSRSAATLGVVATETTTGVVPRGRTGLMVTARVVNAGANAVGLTTATLRFLGVNSVDRSSGYTVSAARSNASSLSGNSSALLTFTVDVASGAAVGWTTIQALVGGTDLVTNRSSSASVADQPASFTVTAGPATPPALVFGRLQAPARVSVDETFFATVAVANSGETTAAVSSAVLGFPGVGLSASALAGNPSQLGGGASGRFRFRIEVLSGAATGDRTATLALVATAVPGGETAGRTQPLTGTVRVLLAVSLGLGAGPNLISLPLVPETTSGQRLDSAGLMQLTSATALGRLRADRRFEFLLPGTTPISLGSGEAYVLLCQPPARAVRLEGLAWPDAARSQTVKPPIAAVGYPFVPSATLEDLRSAAGASYIVETRVGRDGRSRYEIYLPPTTPTSSARAGAGYLLNVPLEKTLRFP
ncbi:MAG: hypothetical protein HY303_02810 [Candidatus Wallbacteria bacterium]|nr:hypothetical protein [Candidatus Wallbacteria bacterium]